MLRFSLAVLFLGGIGACASRPAAGPVQTLLGLQVNVKDGGGADDFKAMLMEQKRLGMDGCVISVKWSELEPEPGKIDVKKLGDDLAGATAFGWQPVLTLQTIDTLKRVVPKDLEGEPWDSAKMRARFGDLLKQVAGKLGDHVIAVSLGNEVDGYLALRPAELEPYKGFLAEGRKALRLVKPGLPVGVTCMLEGRRAHPALVDGLFKGLDAVFFTYYPTIEGMGVREPATVGPDLDAMIASAGGRPLVLQEIGYPAAPLLGSSDARQAEFVTTFYRELAKRRAKVTMASYFLQVDFSPKLVDMLVGYYGIDQPKFRAFLSSLGLRRSDGSARPGLAAFEAATKVFRESK